MKTITYNPETHVLVPREPNHNWCAELSALKAENEALRKDAARLDWVEHQDFDDLSFTVLVDQPNDGMTVVSIGAGWHLGNNLRAAIDVAMIAAAPQPEPVESEPVAEHELQDTRCECCGYMTYHREHMGCIRSSTPQPDRTAELDALKADSATAWAQAHRLALELECLLLDTKDNAIVSKWWDSGMEALSEYQRLKPGAAEEAEVWTKVRKEML